MNRGAWQAYSPWGRKRVGRDLVTKQPQCKGNHQEQITVREVTGLLIY